MTERAPHAVDPSIPASPDTALRERSARLERLLDAWQVLEAAGVAGAGTGIRNAGPSIGDYLDALARAALDGQPVEERALAVADAGLDEIETSLGEMASEIAIPQLKAILPGTVRSHRSGVLELLDAMVGDDGEAAVRHRLAAVDCLITALCSEGAAMREPVDPVGLTPRLARLCQRAEAANAPAVGSLEAEYHAASQAPASPAHELERRKHELGLVFFAPSVLRAITAFNVSRVEAPAPVESRPEPEPQQRNGLLLPDDDDILSADDADEFALEDLGDLDERDDRGEHDEALLEKEAETDGGKLELDDGSVFDSPALARVLAALRRRVAGEAQAGGPVDRIVWCLDLGYATQGELSLLLESAGGSYQTPRPTAVLVGLLCRSLVVLSEELPDAGLCPERLSHDWVSELDIALKSQVNQLIVEGEYDRSCEVSEFRTKFLEAPLRDARLEQRDSLAPRAPREDPKAVRREARQLASEALDGPVAGSAPLPTLGERLEALTGGAHLAKLYAAAAAVLLVAAAMAYHALAPVPGQLALSGDELAGVSQLLEDGVRNGDGRGPAFVGTIDGEAWAGLDRAARERAAVDMIAALRLRGVRNIVVRDAAGRVRIQALGQGRIQIPDFADVPAGPTTAAN